MTDSAGHDTPVLPMARQLKQKRQKRLHFRLTDEQYEAYMSAAERDARDISDWARLVLDMAVGLRGQKKCEVA